jgi:phage repressor protein C with HTH and peptisase S24 domain
MEGQLPMRRLPSEQQDALRRDEYDAQQNARPKAAGTLQEQRAGYDDGEFVSVERYDVSAAMGNGEEVFEERLLGALKFRRDWLRTRGIEPGNARLLDGHGDSMEPLLFDRDLILIDKGAATNWGDGVYCIRMDGRLMMKRLQRMPGGVKIISENSSKYQPISLDLTDEHSQREFAVIGKMRWFARET